MSRRLLSAAWALSSASYALGQATTPTINPLNEFIGAAASAASVLNSAHAKETAAAASASSASAAAVAPSTSAPAAEPSNNSRRNMIIAVVCAVIGAILLLAIVLGICCFLKRHGRRRRNQKGTAIDDDDEKGVHAPEPVPPLNPGRTYSPLAQNRGIPNTSLPPKPTVLATGPTQHSPPRNQNPFVPVPPSPRKPPYSNSAFIDTHPRSLYHDSYTSHPHESYSTAQPYLSETSPLYAAAPPSRPNSRPPSGTGLPTSATAERPLTPIGLSGIGQPYDDMHVHVLETEDPSPELHRSTMIPEPPIQRHHTPPQLPSRSPHRLINTFGDSSTASSTTNSGSGDDWRRSHVIGSGVVNGGPAGNTWTSPQTRYSNGTSGVVLPGPPAPWDAAQPVRRSADRPRHSPTAAAAPWTADRDRRGSATSINGHPRRQRFSDLQADGGSGNGNGNGHRDSRDGTRYPPASGGGVVGEAL